MSGDYIDIHTHNPNSETLSIQSLYQFSEVKLRENLFYSAGFHPWFIEGKNWEQSKNELVSILSHDHVIAFGEIGLDRKSEVSFSLQKEWFEKQIELFSKSHLRVCFIHCVRAWNDLLPIFKNSSLKDKFFILHDFNSSKEEFEQLIKIPHLYFSLGQNMVRSKSRIHQFLNQIPLDRLFFETDDSQQSIESIYTTYCSLTGVKLEQLQQVIQANYQRLFS